MKTLPRTIALGLLSTAFIGGNALIASATPKGPVPFTSFDMNKDGSVSKDEFSKAIEKMKATNTAKGARAPNFVDVDTNKDGSISKTELASAQSKHGHGATSDMNAQKGANWQWQ